MQPATDYVMLICWVTVCIYWFISARQVKATVQRQRLSSSLVHLLPFWLGWFLMAFDHLLPSLNRSLTPRTNLTMMLGVGLCVAGLFVCIWSRHTLAGNWSSSVTFKENHELIKIGPYRFVRHPIYTGLLLMCLGTVVEFGKVRFWLAFPCWLISFWIKLKQEEKLMLEHFPDAYPAYKKQVKSLVPFLI